MKKFKSTLALLLALILIFSAFPTAGAETNDGLTSPDAPLEDTTVLDDGTSPPEEPKSEEKLDAQAETEGAYTLLYSTGVVDDSGKHIVKLPQASYSYSATDGVVSFDWNAVEATTDFEIEPSDLAPITALIKAEGTTFAKQDTVTRPVGEAFVFEAPTQSVYTSTTNTMNPKTYCFMGWACIKNNDARTLRIYQPEETLAGVEEGASFTVMPVWLSAEPGRDCALVMIRFESDATGNSTPEYILAKLPRKGEGWGSGEDSEYKDATGADLAQRPFDIFQNTTVTQVKYNENIAFKCMKPGEAPSVLSHFDVTGTTYDLTTGEDTAISKTSSYAYSPSAPEHSAEPVEIGYGGQASMVYVTASYDEKVKVLLHANANPIYAAMGKTITLPTDAGDGGWVWFSADKSQEHHFMPGDALDVDQYINVPATQSEPATVLLETSGALKNSVVFYTGIWEMQGGTPVVDGKAFKEITEGVTGMPESDWTDMVMEGRRFTLPAAPSREGYRFTGWSVVYDSYSTYAQDVLDSIEDRVDNASFRYGIVMDKYGNEQTFVTAMGGVQLPLNTLIDSRKTYFCIATWEVAPTIAYANAAAELPQIETLPEQSAVQSFDYTIPSVTVPTSEDYAFAGWDASWDGQDTVYAEGDTIPAPRAGVAGTLTAVWTKIARVKFANHPDAIARGLVIQEEHLASYAKTLTNSSSVRHNVPYVNAEHMVNADMLEQYELIGWKRADNTTVFDVSVSDNIEAVYYAVWRQYPSVKLDLGILADNASDVYVSKDENGKDVPDTPYTLTHIEPTKALRKTGSGLDSPAWLATKSNSYRFNGWKTVGWMTGNNQDSLNRPGYGTFTCPNLPVPEDTTTFVIEPAAAADGSNVDPVTGKVYAYVLQAQWYAATELRFDPNAPTDAQVVITGSLEPRFGYNGDAIFKAGETVPTLKDASGKYIFIGWLSSEEWVDTINPPRRYLFNAPYEVDGYNNQSFIEDQVSFPQSAREAVTTLTAQWVPAKTVTLDLNLKEGIDLQNPPSAEDLIISNAQSEKIPFPLSPSDKNMNYWFIGWKASWLGDVLITDGQLDFPASGNGTMTAQWKRFYAVTLADGLTDAMKQAMEAQGAELDAASLELLNKTFNNAYADGMTVPGDLKLSQNLLTFVGWQPSWEPGTVLRAEEVGADYVLNFPTADLGYSDLTLTAVWEPGAEIAIKHVDENGNPIDPGVTYPAMLMTAWGSQLNAPALQDTESCYLLYRRASWDENWDKNNSWADLPAIQKGTANPVLTFTWRAKSTVAFASGADEAQIASLPAAVSNNGDANTANSFTVPAALADENGRYLFQGWVFADAPDRVYQPGETVPFTALERVMQGKWLRQSELTLDLGDVNPNETLTRSQMGKPGETVTVPQALTAEDYWFRGWMLNGVEYTAETYTFVENVDATLVAQWTKKAQVVIEDGLGNEETVTNKEQDTVTLPTTAPVVQENEVLRGWEPSWEQDTILDAGSEVEIPTDETDATLTPVTVKKVEITFDNGNTDATPTASEKNHENNAFKSDSFTVPAAPTPENERYEFDGWDPQWTVEGEAEGESNTLYKDGELPFPTDGSSSGTMQAKWTMRYYVHFENSHEDAPDMSDIVYDANDHDDHGKETDYLLIRPGNNAILPELPDHSPWFFKGWKLVEETPVVFALTLAEEDTEHPDEVTHPIVDKDVKYVAVWERKTQITVEAGVNDEVDAQQLPTIAAGDAQAQLTIPAALADTQKYMFAGWLADWNGNTYSAGESTTYPAEDGKLIAVWKAKAEVTIDDGASTQTQYLEPNKVLQIPTHTDPLYVFMGWNVDGEEKPAEEYTVGENDKKIAAVWQRKVQVFVQNDNTNYPGGNPSNPAPQLPGVALNLPAALADFDNYVFEGWIVSWEGNKLYTPDQAGTQIAYPAADGTITAKWAKRVTVSFGDAMDAQGIPIQPIKGLDSQSMTVPAEPAGKPDGYRFDGWVASWDDKTYQPGASIPFPSGEGEMFMTPQWSKIPTTPTYPSYDDDEVYNPLRPDGAQDRPAAGEDDCFTVLCRVLNVRERPTTDSKRIGRLTRGAVIHGEVEDGWVRILYNGKVAYISAAYVEADADHIMLDEPKEGRVLCRTLNVRAGAGTRYAKLGTLRRGAEVKVLEICDGWYRIESPRAKDGTAWVCAKYIEMQP